MPDSVSVAAPPRFWLRPVGLGLATIGGIGMLIAAFLHWFTVTTHLPNIAAVAGMPSELSAKISGLGSVTMPALGDRDVSSSVPTNAAWAGWSIIVFGLGAIVAAALSTFGPPKIRRYAGPAIATFGVLGVAIAVYALFAPVGTETVRVQGFPLQMQTTAAVGPYLALISAVLVAIGASFLLVATRSATGGSPAPPTATAAAGVSSVRSTGAGAPVGPGFDPRRPAPQRPPQTPVGRADTSPGPPQRGPQSPRPPAQAPAPSGPPYAGRRPAPPTVPPLAEAPTRAFATPAAPPNRPSSHPQPPSQRETAVVRRPTPPTRVSPRPHPSDPEIAQRLEGPTGPL